MHISQGGFKDQIGPPPESSQHTSPDSWLFKRAVLFSLRGVGVWLVQWAMRSLLARARHTGRKYCLGRNEIPSPAVRPPLPWLHISDLQ